MMLSEFCDPSTGPLMNKKARLLKDIALGNGESMRKGEVGSILKDYGDGYHFENDDFGCKVSYSEIEILEKENEDD